jgi:hypothetical protein
MVSRHPRLCASAVAFTALACNFPISGDEYRVAGDDPSPYGAGEGDTSADRLARIVSAFAGTNADCATAFREMCAAPIEACARTQACAEFTECVRERASPAAETICSDKLGTTLTDHWLFELTRHCWVERHEECPIGVSLDCLEGYERPASDRSNVVVSQQLLTVNQPSEEADYTVFFCPGIETCSDPVVKVSVDPRTATYEVTLDVGGKNFGIGNFWEGYRLVEGSSIYPSVVAANLPIWGRRVEITRLLARSTVDTLSAAFMGDATNAAFVQIVDCQSEPLPGVSFAVPTSEQELVVYVKDFVTPTSGPTVATGAAAIYGHEANALQVVEARMGDRLIAAWQGWVTHERPLYLRMHPNLPR